MKARGVDAYQTFGTADLGIIAYETAAREGLVVNEDIIVEIVRPGTGDPVAEGDVGEIVVTTLDPHHPADPPRARRPHRRAAGQALAGGPICASRAGWAAPTRPTKVKGMFVRPEQIAEIGNRHPELGPCCASS
jgi:phenylacetate-CoA ligase